MDPLAQWEAMGKGPASSRRSGELLAAEPSWGPLPDQSPLSLPPEQTGDTAANGPAHVPTQAESTSSEAEVIKDAEGDLTEGQAADSSPQPHGSFTEPQEGSVSVTTGDEPVVVPEKPIVVDFSKITPEQVQRFRDHFEDYFSSFGCTWAPFAQYRKRVAIDAHSTRRDEIRASARFIAFKMGLSCKVAVAEMPRLIADTLPANFNEVWRPFSSSQSGYIYCAPLDNASIQLAVATTFLAAFAVPWLERDLLLLESNGLLINRIFEFIRMLWLSAPLLKFHLWRTEPGMMLRVFSKIEAFRIPDTLLAENRVEAFRFLHMFLWFTETREAFWMLGHRLRVWWRDLLLAFGIDEEQRLQIYHHHELLRPLEDHVLSLCHHITRNEKMLGSTTIYAYLLGNFANEELFSMRTVCALPGCQAQFKTMFICSRCRLSCACSEEHARLAWESHHRLFCYRSDWEQTYDA